MLQSTSVSISRGKNASSSTHNELRYRPAGNRSNHNIAHESKARTGKESLIEEDEGDFDNSEREVYEKHDTIEDLIES